MLWMTSVVLTARISAYPQAILEYGIVCIKRKDSNAEEIIRGDAVLSEVFVSPARAFTRDVATLSPRPVGSFLTTSIWRPSGTTT